MAMAIGAIALPASAQLFGPGDHIIAVDPDVSVLSSYPDAESMFECLDQDANSKYLNFGKLGTGLIFTPAYGASTVQSIQFVTANDAPGRDPASFELYGTNDPISSEDNSAGDAENWTLLASGDLSLPNDRFSAGAVHDFSNGTSYTAWKLIFRTVKDVCENSMQIADVYLFTGSGGTGDHVESYFDNPIAVGTLKSESRYPCSEIPQNAIDGDVNTKHLNFGRENSGIIVSRGDGAAVVVESFTITTANDYPERDPTSWELYGTNDPIVSQDNSTGDAENWTSLGSGALSLPDDRFTEGPTVTVSNSTAYTGYKLLFPSIKDNTGGFPGDSAQYAEVFFDGTGGGCAADFNHDSAVDTRDVIAFLNAWSIGDSSADMDGNGVVDTRDVITFLNLWTNGC
ncbi:MAG: hypothetical protein IPJ41_03140 [Phycisphaerales bacterium]|nr:hypothetical protein [Phycisphaerales bacterium]